MKYIDELIRTGRLAFSEAAEDEFDQEQEVEETEEKEDEEANDDGDKVELDPFDALLEDANNLSAKTQGSNDWENPLDEPNDEFDAMQNQDDWAAPGNEPIDGDAELGELLDSTLPAEDYDDESLTDSKPIRKIQTVDVVSKVIGKFDEYANKVDLLTWKEIVTVSKKAKKKREITYWDYIEDVHKLLNKTLGNQEFVYLDIYNNLYEKINSKVWEKGLHVYSHYNYGRPYITEGLFLLMYELTFDWAAFLIKFLSENPEINAEEFEDDSFVKKFPNLTLLTYIAKLVTESEEFDDFMTNEKAFDLIDDENEYNLTMAQVKKKKDMIKSAGESLTYYANVVKESYADILVGVLDKLGTVIWLHNNCKMSFHDRLTVISELIRTVASKKPIPLTPTETDEETAKPIEDDIFAKPENLYNTIQSSLKTINVLSDKLVLARHEARLLLDSDKENFILKITNE